MTDMLTVADAERSFAAHEHRELAAGIRDIEMVAWSVGWTSTENLAAGLRRVTMWVSTVLTPHALWEDAVVYPEIDAKVGTDWATKLMRHEHRQIAAIATRIDRDRSVIEDAMTHDRACEVRADLVALATLLRAHIEREELFLLPILASTPTA